MQVSPLPSAPPVPLTLIHSLYSARATCTGGRTAAPARWSSPTERSSAESGSSGRSPSWSRSEEGEAPSTQQRAIKQEEGAEEEGVCSHCHTTDTSHWRRNSLGQPECNACNLYWRKHGTPRPLELANRGRGGVNRRVRVAVKQEEPTHQHEYKPVIVVKAEPIGRDWDAEGYAPAQRVRQVRRSMRSAAVERRSGGLPEDFDFGEFMGGL